MKTLKLSHLLFSLSVIAALMLAAFPSAPAHALGNSSAGATTLSANANGSPAAVIVCKSVVKWRDGHRIVVRVCHRVPPKPEAGGS